MIAAFMGSGAAPPTNQGASGSVGVEDNIQQPDQKRQFFGGRFGGNRDNADDAAGAGNGGGILGGLLGGLTGGGGSGEKVTGPPEARVAAVQGAGATSGLPTCADDGTVTMTLRQVCSIPLLLPMANTETNSSTRSTKTAPDPSPPTSTAHLAAQTNPPCSLQL